MFCDCGISSKLVENFIMQLGCQLRLMLGSQELDVYEIVFVICAYGNSLKASHVLGGQS